MTQPHHPERRRQIVAFLAGGALSLFIGPFPVDYGFAAVSLLWCGFALEATGKKE